MTTRSVLQKPSLLPLLGVVAATVAGGLALASGRLQTDLEPKTAFKSAGARADEKTLLKARAIKRRMEAKKIEESSV